MCAIVDRPSILACQECDRRDISDARGWEAHLCDIDDDGQDELLVYCPACAAREFHCHTGTTFGPK